MKIGDKVKYSPVGRNYLTREGVVLKVNSNTVIVAPVFKPFQQITIKRSEIK